MKAGRWLWPGLPGVVLALALPAWPALAQQSVAPEGGAPITQDNPPPAGPPYTLGGAMPGEDQLWAESMVGLPVEDANGDQIGEVADLLIDIETGAIDRLVVSTEGLLALGDVRYGVLWRDLRVDRDAQRVILAMTQEELEAATKATTEGSGAD